MTLSKMICLIFVLDAIVWYQVFAYPLPKDKVYFLNVGQGDSELISTQGKRILVDTGPDGRSAKELEKIVPRSDKYLDMLLLTHNEADHIGGTDDIFKEYKIGIIGFNGKLDPENSGLNEILKKAKDLGIPVIKLSKGDNIDLGGAKLDTLSPTEDLLGSAAENDSGLVELFTAHGLQALFPADIGSNIEQALLGNGLGQVQLVKVPHHGSKNSVYFPFWETLRPTVSVIEVGADNRYGHPAKESLDELKKINSRIFRTDQDGTIEVELKGSALSIITTK